MNAHDRQSGQESRDENRSDAGEKDDDDAEHDEHAEGFALGEGTAEEDERWIGGAEEVEEEPGGEEAEEEEERERIREEGDAEDEGEEGEVVDAEVGVVLADAEGGLGEGFGSGKCGAVDELRPGAALGEAVSDGFGDVGEEDADGWGGHRLLGLGGVGAAGGCGGGV
ncbi:hypothetical protein L1049_007601 [Liquidambar formosana]|uniref:Uncharacterized protein n=1 Tax=Liquidambar formosana TaxID=63359 RepID=A0AAP0S1Q1_LIQFO